MNILHTAQGPLATGLVRISFCPRAITVPSVDRLSKTTSLQLAWIQKCASYSSYIHCSLAEQEYLSEELPRPALYMTSLPHDYSKIRTVFSFLGRIFDKRDSFSRVDETDRTKTEKSVSFDSTSPPRLTDQRPTSTTRQPTADSKVPLFASSRGSSTRCLVWRFSVNISSSPKNLFLF